MFSGACERGGSVIGIERGIACGLQAIGDEREHVFLVVCHQDFFAWCFCHEIEAEVTICRRTSKRHVVTFGKRRDCRNVTRKSGRSDLFQTNLDICQQLRAILKGGRFCAYLLDELAGVFKALTGVCGRRDPGREEPEALLNLGGAE